MVIEYVCNVFGLLDVYLMEMELEMKNLVVIFMFEGSKMYMGGTMCFGS